MLRRGWVSAAALDNCSIVPAPTDVGGCLPCARGLPPNKEADSQCLRCLLHSRKPFFLGRPGLGGPEEAACYESIGGRANNNSHLWSSLRRTLKSLNGVVTASADDAKAYARCYAAAINATDLIVRLGDSTPFFRHRIPLTPSCHP